MFRELKNPAFYKKVLPIMLPILVQQLITTGINFFDNIMVGAFAEAQISAVSASNQFYNIFQMMCVGVGSGVTVMSAQFWGRKETDQIKVVAGIGFRFALIVSVVFSVLSIGFPGPVLSIFTKEPAFIEAGIGYLRLLGITFIMYGLSNTASFVLRSTGQVRVPLISSCIAFVLNIFFNWVFIFGKLGAPQMECRGAAVGTIIARSFEFLFIMGYVLFRENIICFRFRHFFASGKEFFGKFMRYSIPVFISDSFLGIGIAAESAVMGHVVLAEGITLLAASSITMSLHNIMNVVIMSLAQSAAVIIGNTIGEGKKDRAFREGVAYIIIAVVCGLLFVLVYYFAKDAYIGIYNVDPVTIAAAQEVFLYLMIMTPFQTLSHVQSKGIMRGGGDTRFIMVADIILLWAVSLPLGSVAAFVWHLSPFWIVLFLKLEYGAKGIIFFIRFLSKKWIREIKARS